MKQNILQKNELLGCHLTTEKIKLSKTVKEQKQLNLEIRKNISRGMKMRKMYIRILYATLLQKNFKSRKIDNFLTNMLQK